jgi:uncharacterized RDD family membrane protein YckC
METNAQGLKYAGFWRRFGAHLIDTVIWMVPAFFIQHSLSGDALKYGMIVWVVASMLISIWYHMWLPVKFGGTPGFRLLKAKIKKVSGEPITFREGFLRYMILYFFVAVMNAGTLMAYFNVPDLYFLSPSGNAKLLMEATPTWVFWVMVVMQIWLLAEFVVLFTNKQRRVISDFIAGTVVLQDRDPTVTDAKTDFVS